MKTRKQPAAIVPGGVPWAVAPQAFTEIGAAMRWRSEHPAQAADLEQKAVVAVEAARQGRGRGRVAGAVAVLPLRGVITPRTSFMSYLFGGMGLVDFMDEFRSALADDDVGSILIDVDSPGGRTSLVPEVGAEIRAARGKKPIVAIANTTAASAAYWIATQADELVVTPSGFVGSVGTYIVHEDWSGMNEQLGIDPTYIVSAASPHKVDGNPDEPLSEDARETWQQDVDDITAQFFQAIAKGRGTNVKDVRENYGQGRCLSATRALDAGMVDTVQTYDEVIARLVTGSVTAGRSAPARSTLVVDGRVIADAVLDAARESAAAEPTSSSEDDTEPVAGSDEAAPAAAEIPPWLLMPTPAPTTTR